MAALLRGAPLFAQDTPIQVQPVQVQDGNRDEIARAMFLRGTEASRSGRWLEARAAFKRSLEYVAKASTLFNLAVADVELGLGDEALEALDAFSRLAKEPEHTEMIERARLVRSLATALSERRKPAALADTELMQLANLDEPAREAVDQATEFYRQGELVQALLAFERAYELSHRPELLFSIAVAADRLGATERARPAYQAFAAALPDTPQAATARARILLLGEKQPPRALVPAAEAAAASVKAQSQPARPPVASSKLPKALVATGALLGASSLGTAVWWADRKNENDICRRAMCTAYSERHVRLEYGAAIATTLTLAAVAIPLTIWGALQWRRRSAAANVRAASLVVRPSSAQVSMRLSF